MTTNLITLPTAAAQLAVSQKHLLELAETGEHREPSSVSWISCELVHALRPSDRRVFSRPEAASYVSASVGYFDKLVRLGLMPRSLPLPGVKRWDKNALDIAIDALSGLSGSNGSTAESPLDAWRRKRG